MLIAGEISGDLHGSYLAKSLKEINNNVILFGIGSSMMKKQNVEILFDITDKAVIGFAEAVQNFFPLRKLLKNILQVISIRRPDLIVLIDYSGFNLKVAKVLENCGIPIIYYFPPQVWASRKYRVKKVARMINKVIAVFPFEVEIYKNAGADFAYFGHPLLDIVKPKFTPNEARRKFGVEPGSPVLGLLPGSRNHEIERILPAMLTSALRLKERIKNIQFLLPVASPVLIKKIKQYLTPNYDFIKLIQDYTYDVINISDLVLVTSGSATLEAAILNTPMIILYKTSIITWLLAKFMLRLPFIGLANIVAGNKIVSEFIQDEVSPELIVEESEKILTDEKRRQRIIDDLKEAVKNLGPPGAIEKSAKLLLNYKA